MQICMSLRREAVVTPNTLDARSTDAEGELNPAAEALRWASRCLAQEEWMETLRKSGPMDRRAVPFARRTAA